MSHVRNTLTWRTQNINAQAEFTAEALWQPLTGNWQMSVIWNPNRLTGGHDWQTFRGSGKEQIGMTGRHAEFSGGLIGYDYYHYEFSVAY